MTTTYTSNGLVATVTDARGGRTTYEYDGFDRLKKTRFPHPSSVNTSSSTDYEELTWGTSGTGLGLVTARRLRDGTSVSFTRDDLGRVTFADAPGSTPDVTTAYDSFGRVVSLSQSGHALSYAYDQLSRLVSETQPLGTVSYEYDAAGRRTKLTYPSSSSYYVEYDWSPAGDLLKIRENGATSGLGVLASFAYDDLGRRVSLTRGNGAVTAYGFDAASRLDELDLDLDGGTTTSDPQLDFARNPASQIVSKTSSNAAYDWTIASGFAATYTADYLNKYLTRAGATITHDSRGPFETPSSLHPEGREAPSRRTKG